MLIQANHNFTLSYSLHIYERKFASVRYKLTDSLVAFKEDKIEVQISYFSQNVEYRTDTKFLLPMDCTFGLAGPLCTPSVRAVAQSLYWPVCPFSVLKPVSGACNGYSLGRGQITTVSAVLFIRSALLWPSDYLLSASQLFRRWLLTMTFLLTVWPQSSHKGSPCACLLHKLKTLGCVCVCVGRRGSSSLTEHNGTRIGCLAQFHRSEQSHVMSQGLWLASLSISVAGNASTTEREKEMRGHLLELCVALQYLCDSVCSTVFHHSRTSVAGVKCRYDYYVAFYSSPESEVPLS